MTDTPSIRPLLDVLADVPLDRAYRLSALGQLDSGEIVEVLTDLTDLIDAAHDVIARRIERWGLDR